MPTAKFLKKLLDQYLSSTAVKTSRYINKIQTFENETKNNKNAHLKEQSCQMPTSRKFCYGPDLTLERVMQKNCVGEVYPDLISGN